MSENQLKDLLRKIIYGDSKELKEAKSLFENLWKGDEMKEKVTHTLLNEIKHFDSIKNIQNKISFIKTLKLICLRYGFEKYKFLSDFLLKAIQNDNGNLRYAVVKDFKYLVPDYFIMKNKNEYYEELKLVYFKSVDIVNDLLVKYNKPEYLKFDYVNDLPPSIYKSLEQVLNVMLRRKKVEDMYKKYLSNKKSETFLSNYNLKGQKDKWELYYDAMDLLNEHAYKAAVILLKRAIEIDPEFVAAYVGLVASYEDMKNKRQMNKFIDIGFQLTKLKFPKWPKRLLWGETDNRQYFRAIFYKANQLHIRKDYKEAEKLYKLLLQFEPNDNIGARYSLAGLYEGLTPEEVDGLFKKSNEEQNWQPLENLLQRQNKIHNFFQYPHEDDNELDED